MKQLLTLDNFMVAFVSALGYGFGASLSALFGWPDLACMGASMVVGVAIESLVNKIAFSEAVQKKPINRVFTYIAFVLVFLIGHFISVKWMGVSMLEYLEEQFKFVVIAPILGFVINLVIRAYRIRKIRKLYGDGNEGYVFDVNNEEIEELNKENEPVRGEFDTDYAVKTRTGTYIGEKQDGVVLFLGIPYAKPPVGELRWKAPHPLPASNAVFEAKNFGASAIQIEHKGLSLKHHRQSEDCLTLNIVVGRQEAERKKPVLMLFHHGDFSYGGSADPLMYGDAFVSSHDDIVFVSFNYRLGIFGFIDFSEVPGGDAYPDALNLGLLDQIAALKWVKENIDAFGGDPEQITVMGFESGATSISLLAASDQAKGLFQRAFVFYGSPEVAHETREAPRELAKRLLEETHTKTMDELSQLETKALKDASQSLWLSTCVPTCDGALVPMDVYRAYQDGAASGIEFIFGFPSDEGRVFRSFVGGRSYNEYVCQSMSDIQSRIDGSIADALQQYINIQAKESTELEAKSKLVELWNDLCIYRCAANLSGSGNATHLLYWDEKPLIENLSSGTVDVAAVFLGNSDALQMYGNVMDDDLSEVLQALLHKFISGNTLQLYPNEIKGIDAFEWKAFPQALTVSDEVIRTGEFRSAGLLYLIVQPKR